MENKTIDTKVTNYFLKKVGDNRTHSCTDIRQGVFGSGHDEKTIFKYEKQIKQCVYRVAKKLHLNYGYTLVKDKQATAGKKESFHLLNGWRIATDPNDPLIRENRIDNENKVNSYVTSHNRLEDSLENSKLISNEERNIIKFEINQIKRLEHRLANLEKEKKSWLKAPDAFYRNTKLEFIQKRREEIIAILLKLYDKYPGDTDTKLLN